MKLEKQNKHYWWILLIAVVAIAAPFAINWFILSETPEFWIFGKGVVGNGTHWLGFWATYIGAVASFAMVFITWRTLVQNRKQLDELKRQWEEQNRANLIFSVESVHCFYCLKIQNAGNRVAKNINVQINQTFIDKVFIESFRNTLLELSNANLIIPPNETKLYIITYQHPTKKGAITVGDTTVKNCEMIDSVKTIFDEPIFIIGNYSDGKINESFTISQHIKNILQKKDEVAVQLENFYALYKYVNYVNVDIDETCCDCSRGQKCIFAKNKKPDNGTR